MDPVPKPLSLLPQIVNKKHVGLPNGVRTTTYDLCTPWAKNATFLIISVKQ